MAICFPAVSEDKLAPIDADSQVLLKHKTESALFHKWSWKHAPTGTGVYLSQSLR
jgi:hypothetical protein